MKPMTKSDFCFGVVKESYFEGIYDMYRRQGTRDSIILGDNFIRPQVRERD